MLGRGGNCLGQYARARVSRDVRKPLQRCVSITTGKDNEKHIILIRYERLPEYCSACGRVGHDLRHCTDSKADKQKRSFGVWLKATRTFEGRRGRGDGQGGYGKNSMANSVTRGDSRQEEKREGERGMKERKAIREEGEEEHGGSVRGEGSGSEEREVERKEEDGGLTGEGSGESERGEEIEKEDLSNFMEVGDNVGESVLGLEEEMMEPPGFELEKEEREELIKRPNKVAPKNRKKGNGKEWKRLARETKGGEKRDEGEGGSEENKRGEKRKGGLNIDLENLTPKQKLAGSTRRGGALIW